MKKFLSIILAILMTFTVATSAYAVSLSDVDDSDKNVSVSENIDDGNNAEDNDTALESLIAFVKDLIKKIHNLVHGLFEKISADCLFCSDAQDDATDDTQENVTDDAQNGTVEDADEPDTSVQEEEEEVIEVEEEEEVIEVEEEEEEVEEEHVAEAPDDDIPDTPV